MYKIVRSRNVLKTAIIFGALRISGVLACGPDFPLELTQVRVATLFGLSEGNFFYEAGHLIPVPTRFLAPDPSLGYGFATSHRFSVNPTRVGLETEGYTDTQSRQYHAARAAADATAAFAATPDLPLGHRHYLAGAVSFQHRHYVDARAHFNAIVDLGNDNDRLLFAHYMLGKTEYAEHGLGEEAVAAFRTLRELGYRGMADPHGLAITSLGDEAYWYLQVASSVGIGTSNEADTTFTGNFIQALELYAEQAAQEQSWNERSRQQALSENEFGYRASSSSGQSSLLMLTRQLIQHPEQRALVIDQPMVQHLLMSYFFARTPEADELWRKVAESDAGTQPDWEAYSRSRDSAGIAAPFTKALLLDELMVAMERFEAAPKFADRAAAVLYRAGDFERAARLAELSESGLAYWVRAKLALRAGDYAAATSAYAIAARNFPENEQWVEYGFGQSATVSCRVRAEAATLALSRGDYLQALDLFFQAGAAFYNDLAYVAERVLTIDELRQFVDSRMQAQPDASQSRALRSYYAELDIGSALRAILARRLMRDGQHRDALQYFDDFGERELAKAYGNALENAGRLEGIDRAKALYTAAVIARRHGMEILAAELEPDFKVYEGDFADRTRPTDPAGLLGKDESERVREHTILPDIRFSYRYIATDLVEQATALLPPRSQAYAAALCHATNWMINRAPDRAWQLYQTYIKHGAYVSFGRAFGTGRGCEDPDFPRAQALQDKQETERRIRLLKQWMPYGLGATALLAVFASTWWWKRRGTS